MRLTLQIQLYTVHRPILRTPQLKIFSRSQKYFWLDYLYTENRIGDTHVHTYTLSSDPQIQRMRAWVQRTQYSVLTVNVLRSSMLSEIVLDFRRIQHTVLRAQPSRFDSLKALKCLGPVWYFGALGYLAGGLFYFISISKVMWVITYWSTLVSASRPPMPARHHHFRR